MVVNTVRRIQKPNPTALKTFPALVPPLPGNSGLTGDIAMTSMAMIPVMSLLSANPNVQNWILIVKTINTTTQNAMVIDFLESESNNQNKAIVKTVRVR